MKKIDTLVDDIYGVFSGPVEVDPKIVEEFGMKLGRILVERITEQRGKTVLRLSNVGQPCSRKLWYAVHSPELSEPLSGEARLKFLIGDITEHVVIFLAKLAGHVVTDEQETVSVDGVEGHIDCLIDGEVVDVKSCSPYSFEKFENGLRPEQDAFGYLPQLGSYAEAKSKKHGYFLALHKVLGKLCLDRHSDLPLGDELRQSIRNKRQVLSGEHPPPRAYIDEADGQSGNKCLGVACSYCEFKGTCWPGLRTIPYARGPRFFTKVVREPVLRGKK